MFAEESFIILGTTPTPSMEDYITMDGIKDHTHVCDKQWKTTGEAKGQLETYLDFEKKEFLILSELTDNPLVSVMSDDVSNVGMTKQDSLVEMPATESLLTVQDNSNLAANFLLGEVPIDALKSNVYTQFPSLCIADINAENSLKLQNFMCEYVELKKHLQLTNATIRRHFSIINDWQNENKTFKDEQKQELERYHQLIAKLQKENEELRKELKSKIYVTHLSTSQAADKHLEAKPHVDYFNMKQLQDKLSEVAAQNLELQDMIKLYTDEINCLKVNLTSAEELLKKANADINTLKIKNDETNRFCKNNKAVKNEMKGEIDLLKAQLTVYRQDFETECTLRAELFKKNKMLLEDLKVIQQRNQQLLEEAERRENSLENTRQAD